MGGACSASGVGAKKVTPEVHVPTTKNSAPAGPVKNVDATPLKEGEPPRAHQEDTKKEKDALLERDVTLDEKRPDHPVHSDQMAKNENSHGSKKKAEDTAEKVEKNGNGIIADGNEKAVATSCASVYSSELYDRVIKQIEAV